MNDSRMLVMAMTVQSLALFAYVLARSVETLEESRSVGVKVLALIASVFSVLALVGAGYAGFWGLEYVADVEALLGM